MSARRQNSWSAFVGVLSALVAVAVTELGALMIAPPSSPVAAVGSLVIDLSPPWVKDFTIGLFGTADKIVLLALVGMLVLVLAVVIGMLEYRRRLWGVAALVAVGLVAMAAVVTRSEANWLWAVPTLLGVVAGAACLRSLTKKLHAWAAAARSPQAAVTRRNFLAVAGTTTAAALVVGLSSRAINASTTALRAARNAVTLPRATTAAPPIPAGAELGIPGLAPVVSDNEHFYRIDTALQAPVIEPETWRLVVTGLVEREVSLTFDELLALPLTEKTVTLACVSNEVGGTLIGNAVWLGYPIRELLAKAGPRPGADMVLSRSIDGFTASTPLEVLLDPERDSLLAVGMNGEPLPVAHGFPVRMVVPGLYGYVSATKWLVELKVTTFAKDAGYWTTRGWSARGPVKLSSRIDVPRSGSQLRAGRVAIAGVAWAQHTGVGAVEVRIDEGPWRDARLADAISVDTWRQWIYEWDATSGSHLIEVRATDAAGTTQSAQRVPVAPNGAEGWHSVTVTVA